MLEYELEPNQYSLRVYDSARGDMDYVSSALIQVNGDVGWVRQVSNPTFLDCLIGNLDEILTKLGVRRLEAAMNPAMARAFRMKLKGRAKYEELKHVVSSGRDLVWAALEPFGSEAGAVRHPNLRQKENHMGKKTLKVTVELVDDQDKVEFSAPLVWNAVDAQRVLFLEKHLIGFLVNLNAEADKVLSASK